MSTTSKIVFGLSAVTSVGIIVGVHYSQESQRAQLKEGIIRDTERRKRRQIANLATLQQQIDLTKELARREKTTTSMAQPTADGGQAVGS